jgi:adenine-specific DNA-methyltransferase
LHPGKDIKVLDFFAGSGTTGAALMELNKEDGGTRSYTLCTNNEISDARAMQYLMESGLIIGKTKKELLTSYKGYQGTKEYKEWLQSDHYESLGICKSVTYERLRKVIAGYTTPKGNEIAGLGGNLSYYKIVK